MFATEPLFAALKRAQFGLFHGKMRQTGNNVPHSKHKTKRIWLPNIHSKRLFSEALGQLVKLKVSTKALKTIKKHGGLDNYVLNTKSTLLGEAGIRLRLQVREQLEVKQQELNKDVKQDVKQPSLW